MRNELRMFYKKLNGASTAEQQAICDDLLKTLVGVKTSTLADWFAYAVTANSDFSQVDRCFIPETRGDKLGRNPVVKLMLKKSADPKKDSADPIKFDLPTGEPYKFTCLQREVPHLRASSMKEQRGKGWIDYVAHSAKTPILGEIKWKGDKSPFYAFIQLLTYLSEIATANQIKRALQHKLFGKDITNIACFDLHIFLANFNDRGEKGPLIESTRKLAAGFKKRLRADHPDFASLVGHVWCISAQVEENKVSGDRFTETKCLWVA